MAAPTKQASGGIGGVGADERVKISITDTTAGFLGTSLVVHVDTPIALNILNPGLNETLELDLDGDQIHIDWIPSSYIRNAAPVEAGDIQDLTAHLKGIDDGLSTITSVSPRLGLEKLFAVAYDNHYTEFTYVGNNLTVIDIWEDNGKTTKLFTRTLSYTGNNVTLVVTVDEQGAGTLTTTFVYFGNNLINTTKAVT